MFFDRTVLIVQQHIFHSSLCTSNIGWSDFVLSNQHPVSCVASSCL